MTASSSQSAWLWPRRGRLPRATPPLNKTNWYARTRSAAPTRRTGTHGGATKLTEHAPRLAVKPSHCAGAQKAAFALLRPYHRSR